MTDLDPGVRAVMVSPPAGTPRAVPYARPGLVAFHDGRPAAPIGLDFDPAGARGYVVRGPDKLRRVSPGSGWPGGARQIS